MRIALIEATEFVGSKILTDALHRGHEATAFVRDQEKLEPYANSCIHQPGNIVVKPK
jgi:putative NADH-flavin reductase